MRESSDADRGLKSDTDCNRGRIVLVDALRGFSIFGILLVNLLYFSGPYYGPEFPRVVEARANGWLDFLALDFIRLVAEGKFLSMFSFLFGLSFALQLVRAEERGIDFRSVFRRRLFILLLIGVAHAFLLSAGDVLVQYALLGFLLLRFRESSDRSLLVWAGLSFCFLLLLTTASLLSPEPPVSFMNRLVERSLRIYAHGSLTAILSQRAFDVAFYYLGVIFHSGYLIFAMFLLGAYAGRRRLFDHARANKRFFQKITGCGFGLGVMAWVVSLSVASAQIGVHFTLHALSTILVTVTAPALGLAYMSLIALTFQRAAWHAKLLPFARVGRMALSNYVFQSAVCNLLFYSYGLRLYGRTPLKFLPLLAVVIFVIQLVLSTFWLKHFRFGPAEWLWRSLTYGKFQTLLVEGRPGLAS